MTFDRSAAAARRAWIFAGLGLILSAASATAQPTQEQQNAIRGSCRSDFLSNCSSVQPGGSEALQCLERNVAKLSPGCQSAVRAAMPQPAAAAGPPAAAQAVAPRGPAPASVPTAMGPPSIIYVSDFQLDPAVF